MTPQELRALARKCRKWAKSATDPANIALFRIWATDLADEADEMARNIGHTTGTGPAPIISGTGRTVSADTRGTVAHSLQDKRRRAMNAYRGR